MQSRAGEESVNHPLSLFPRPLIRGRKLPSIRRSTAGNKSTDEISCPDARVPGRGRNARPTYLSVPVAATATHLLSRPHKFPTRHSALSLCFPRADEKRRRNFNKFVEAAQLRKREHRPLSGAVARGSFLGKAVFYLYIADYTRTRGRNRKLLSP